MGETAVLYTKIALIFPYSDTSSPEDESKTLELTSISLRTGSFKLTQYYIEPVRPPSTGMDVPFT